MNSYVILGIIAGLPFVLAILMRVNSIYLYMSVAAGLILAQYVSYDTMLALNAFFAHKDFGNYVNLGLLLTPIVLSLFFLRKSMSRSKTIFHLLPLAATCAALGTLIMGYLPGGIQHQLLTNQIGKTADNSQNALIAAATILTLLLAWLTLSPHDDKKKRRR
ncbi:MAG TPA: hypothetical protein VLF39_02825 [Candidatus Saccharimonadales bacterium]|nr:hypothetical protein [Candidatus Saccharimonadales bacterium]